MAELERMKEEMARDKERMEEEAKQSRELADQRDSERQALKDAQGTNSQCNCQQLINWIALGCSLVVFLFGVLCRSGLVAGLDAEHTGVLIMLFGILLTAPSIWVLLGQYYSKADDDMRSLEDPAAGPRTCCGRPFKRDMLLGDNRPVLFGGLQLFVAAGLPASGTACLNDSMPLITDCTSVGLYLLACGWLLQISGAICVGAFIIRYTRTQKAAEGNVYSGLLTPYRKYTPEAGKGMVKAFALAARPSSASTEQCLRTAVCASATA